MKAFRLLCVWILLLAAAFLYSGISFAQQPAEMLQGKWSMRFEARDANANGQLDEHEKGPVTGGDHPAYNFDEGGKGVYYPGQKGMPKSIDIQWRLTEGDKKLVVVMQGATYAYRIQALTTKKLVLETKTIDGIVWEGYSHK